MTYDISVIVQTCPARRELLPKTLSWIEKSDIGKNYTVMEHPEGMKLGEFFLRVIQAMTNVPTRYVIRLEDDSVVNSHILYNISTWPALREENFGAGWLFSPDGPIRDVSKLGRGKLTGELYRDFEYMHAALGILVPTKLMPDIVQYAPPRSPQDFYFTRALWAMGKRLYFHIPSLIENQTRWPSARGHQGKPTASTWSANWCRGDPIPSIKHVRKFHRVAPVKQRRKRASIRRRRRRC